MQADGPPAKQEENSITAWGAVKADRSLAYRVGKRLLQAFERLPAVSAVDDHVHPHFAGVDHVDVDAGGRQAFERADGDARVAAHANARYRQLGDVRAAGDRPAVQLAWPACSAAALAAANCVCGTVKLRLALLPSP